MARPRPNNPTARLNRPFVKCLRAVFHRDSRGGSIEVDGEVGGAVAAGLAVLAVDAPADGKVAGDAAGKVGSGGGICETAAMLDLDGTVAHKEVPHCFGYTKI